MKDQQNPAVIGKFCGEDDKVKAGKPCENCTCGRLDYIYELAQKKGCMICIFGWEIPF